MPNPEPNDYSRRFAAVLSATDPDWARLARIVPEDGSLALELPSPSRRACSPLYLRADGEVTVGFDAWHGHFDQFAGTDEAAEFARALDVFRSLLEERLVVVTIMKGDRVGGAAIADATDNPLEVFTAPGETGVRVRSYLGTFDRDLARPPP